MPQLKRIVAAIVCLLSLVPLAPSGPALGGGTTTIWPDTLSVTSQRYRIVPAMRPARRSVGLALSGGGANGIAQIGVLKALEEEGVPVDYIAGTSMGAVVGGLYSCGYSPAEIEAIAHSLPWQSIISLGKDYSRSNVFLEQQRVRDRATVAIRFDKLKLMIPKSLSSAQALTETLDLLVLNAPYPAYGGFSSLPVRYRAVTTDLVSGQRVTLSSGALSEAMRASSTIPVLFEPVKRGNQQLVDGGLVANLPVDELETFGADYKIAVDTHGSMYATGRELDLPWKAADQAMGILTKQQYPAQLERADIVIAPELDGNKATDFSDIPTLVEAGYRKGKALARTIRSGISTPPSGKGAAVALTSYRRSIKFPADSPDYIEHYRIVSGIVRNAPTAGEALKALLETDLFSRVHAELDQRRKTAVFHLTPLPPISSVRIVGGPVEGLPAEEVKECFEPVVGKAYTTREGTRALEAIVRRYRDRGYSLVHIEECRIRGGALAVVLTSGKVDAVAVARNEGITGMTPITREIKVDPDEPVRLRRAGESLENLYGTGVFSRVSVAAETERGAPGRPEWTQLKFSLSEKPSNVLRIGLRYDETDNAQFLIDYRNENLGGTTSSLGGWLKAGRRNNVLNLEFNMPRIGSTIFTMSSRLFFDQHLFDYREPGFSKEFLYDFSELEDTYGIQKYGFSTAFGTRLGRNGKFILDMTLQNAQSYHDEKGEGVLETAGNDILSVGGQLALDSRNHPQLPTSGNRTNIKYSVATPAFDNEEFFWLLSGTHEENIPLGSRTTLQLAGTAGISAGHVPLSERYFLGGPGNAYSWKFIGLPKYALIGNNIASAALDLRYRPPYDIIFPTSLVLHYNTGNAWERREQIALGRLIHGLGTSIIWETPLGPAQFTISKAFAFLEEAEDQETSSLRFSDTALYFSLGHEF